MNPEEEARQLIDEKLTAAGWLIQDRKDFDRFAGISYGRQYRGRLYAIY